MDDSVTRRLGRAVVPLGAGVLVLALVASLWALTIRERANKRLYLEYEVYKAMTALSDLARMQTAVDDDVKNVIAFGLYAPDGTAIAVYGDAPAEMEPENRAMPPSRFSVGDSSAVLIRSMGGDLPGRRMMGGDAPGRMRGGFPPEPAVSMARMPSFAYIEYSTEGLKAEEAALLLAAAIATAALAGLYALIVAMNRRYAASKEREAKDRELVELGQAARTIAHEIKNPLGVIRIQCGILRRGADEATVSGLTIIDDEAIRLADLADRIRRFLKSGDDGVAPVAAGRFLADFIGRYAGVVEADIDIDDGAVIDIDQGRITEALDNIVANALEASAGAPEKPRLEARARQRRLTVAVLDRGKGVAPDSLGRVFAPFFTTKERGSGLGLALARKNVRASGGELSYADRPGGGAMFTVSIPLSRKPGDRKRD